MSLDPYQLGRSRQQGPKRGHISTETRSRIPTGLKQRDVLLRMQENVLFFSLFDDFKVVPRTEGGGKKCQAFDVWQASRIWSVSAFGEIPLFQSLCKNRGDAGWGFVSENSLWFDVNVSGADTRMWTWSKAICKHSIWFEYLIFQFDGSQFDLIAWRPNLQIKFFCTVPCIHTRTGLNREDSKA